MMQRSLLAFDSRCEGGKDHHHHHHLSRQTWWLSRDVRDWQNLARDVSGGWEEIIMITSGFKIIFAVSWLPLSFSISLPSSLASLSLWFRCLFSSLLSRMLLLLFLMLDGLDAGCFFSLLVSHPLLPSSSFQAWLVKWMETKWPTRLFLFYDLWISTQENSFLFLFWFWLTFFNFFLFFSKVFSLDLKWAWRRNEQKQ